MESVSSLKKLYLFNPTCELAIDNGDKHYTPPETLLKFGLDLSLLPLGYAKAGDAVLSSFPLGESEARYFGWLFGNKVELLLRNDTVMESLQRNFFPAPWGFSPNVYPILERFTTMINPSFEGSPFGQWQNCYRDFFSRLSALRFLEQSSDLLSRLHYSPPFFPQLVDSFEALSSIVGVGNDYVVKSLHSASGRGVFISTNGELNGTQKNMLTKMFKQKRSVVVEPFFQKVIEFSMQFEIDASRQVHFTGLSFFDTDEGGKYLGSRINYDTDSFIGAYSALFDKISLSELTEMISLQLETLIQNSTVSPFNSGVFPEGFTFPFGVDMMIYLDQTNELRLNPCVEINWRYTMGYVANKLSERIDDKLRGSFVVGYSDDWQTRCQTRVASLDYSLSPFACAGFYPLTGWQNGEQFGAYLELTQR